MLHDTMTDNNLTFFCLIKGESVSTAFEVEVASTKTVSALKNRTVDGNQAPAFRDVAEPKDLILWCVSIPNKKQGKALP